MFHLGAGNGIAAFDDVGQDFVCIGNQRIKFMKNKAVFYFLFSGYQSAAQRVGIFGIFFQLLLKGLILYSRLLFSIKTFYDGKYSPNYGERKQNDNYRLKQGFGSSGGRNTAYIDQS